jgi:uncharacterized protein YaaN involved in tellurite resistance
MLKEFANAITTAGKMVAEPLTRINALMQRIEGHLNQLAATMDAQVSEITRLNATLESTRELVRRYADPLRVKIQNAGKE